MPLNRAFSTDSETSMFGVTVGKKIPSEKKTNDRSAPNGSFHRDGSDRVHINFWRGADAERKKYAINYEVLYTLVLKNNNIYNFTFIALVICFNYCCIKYWLKAHKKLIIYYNKL